MRFQIKPAPGEARRGCSALAQERMPPSRATLVMLALYAAVLVAAYFLTPASRPMTILIGIGAVLATTYGLQAEGRRRLRALQTGDPHELETHFIELTPDGIRTWCAHVDARYPWQEFVKVTENREFYLFVRPSGGGAALPKRLLSDAENEALRTRIREWAPDGGAALARELGSSDRAI